MDPQILIRIRTKMSRIPNTVWYIIMVPHSQCPIPRRTLFFFITICAAKSSLPTECRAEIWTRDKHTLHHTLIHSLLRPSYTCLLPITIALSLLQYNTVILISAGVWSKRDVKDHLRTSCATVLWGAASLLWNCSEQRWKYLHSFTLSQRQWKTTATFTPPPPPQHQLVNKDRYWYFNGFPRKAEVPVPLRIKEDWQLP
jgi:hypothetical protein